MGNKLRRVVLIAAVVSGVGISVWSITNMMLGHLQFRPELYALCVLNVMAGVVLLIFDAS
jgi:hypothetical protein